MSDIALSAAQRSSLQSINDASNRINQSQSRLNTGRKVNQVTDDPIAFFRSQALVQQASDLSSRNDTIGQTVSALGASLTASTAVDGFLKQLKGIVQSAEAGGLADKKAATDQLRAVGQQLSEVVRDASFGGVNILAGSTSSLSTQLSNRTAATLTIPGVNLAGPGGLFGQSGVFGANGTFAVSGLLSGPGGVAVAGFSALGTPGGLAVSSANAIFSAVATRIDTAISQNQGVAASIGGSVGVLTNRLRFNQDQVNTLNQGADKLTLADLNTEAATTQSEILRRQLATTALGNSNRAAKAALSLLAPQNNQR